MERDEIWKAIDAERLSLADFLGELSPAEWETPSLCAGWRVRDVAAHLTLAQTGAFTAIVDVVRAGGNMNRMIRDTAIRRAARPPAEYPALLRAMVGSRKKAPGVSDVEPLIDVLVHGQDIARPLGRDRPMPTDAAVVAAGRIWPNLWPFRAAKHLRGHRLVATDASWTAGEGEPVEAPIADLLLLMTGRRTAVPQIAAVDRNSTS